MTKSTPVIIVGGGLAGLTTAALLADLGVRCLLLERHRQTSIQYKFAGISPRSMEIFRSLGLEDEIRSHRTGDQQAGAIARGRNLADPDLQWSGAAWPDARPFSPTQPATCDQHVLEPILCRRAQDLGAEIRFHTEFLSFDQDRHGVRVALRDLGTGREESVAGSYLVAADGASGKVREMLGIGRSGPGVLQHWMNIIFETDLPPMLDGRRFTSCFVSDINGTFTPREDGRWLLALQYAPERGEEPEQFDAARCASLVTRGAGRTGIRAALVDARPWQAAAFVADTFQSGRCFLVGDAAHLMPPTGGFGGNSGIHDAHNLAWKLACAVRGKADPVLLESYDRERRPVIESTLAQALARLQRWFRDLGGRLPPPAEMVPDYDVVFGQRYREGALIAEAGGPAAPFVDHARLSGLPGTRLPHGTVQWQGEPVSTLDLPRREFALLAAAGTPWCEHIRRLASWGPGLRCLAFGSDDLRDPAGMWPSAFGVDPEGAVLVRPDAVVGWRSHGLPEDPGADLLAALRKLGVRSSGLPGDGTPADRGQAQGH